MFLGIRFNLDSTGGTNSSVLCHSPCVSSLCGLRTLTEVPTTNARLYMVYVHTVFNVHRRLEIQGPKQRRRENKRQINIVAVIPRKYETSHSTCSTDNCSTINSSFVSLYFTSSMKLCLQVSINIVVFYVVVVDVRVFS